MVSYTLSCMLLHVCIYMCQERTTFVVSESANCVRSTDAWLINVGIIDVAGLIILSVGLMVGSTGLKDIAEG